MSAKGFTFERIRIPEKLEIALTPEEDQLCTLLDECARYLAEKEGVHTSCRIAGGWVRDKLLGSESNDIDIALENMMGVAFSEKLIKFLTEQKGMDNIKLSVVKSNPDQSKHLETAKVNPVLGFELDLVNLRSEEYAEDSRIPTEITFGTPLQDALRRDITINALFYNVHTRAVEDHTEKGLPDLHSGTVRTPLAPHTTFLDDPLRVLRCVRFASRFGFALVPALAASARAPEIQAAFAAKITKERVGEEMHKMMKGRAPLHSIALLAELDLHDAIFGVPPDIRAKFDGEPAPFESTSLAATAILETLLSSSSSTPATTAVPALHPLLLSQFAASADPTARPRLYLAAALSHLRGIAYTDAKGKPHPACEAALREGMKMGTQSHYLDGIPALFAAWAVLAPQVRNLEDGENRRVTIGLALRDKAVHNLHAGSHWTSSLLFAAVQDLVGAWDAEKCALDGEAARKVVERYNKYTSTIEELGLQGAADAKPLLDGREVVQALSTPDRPLRPGQWTGGVLVRVVEWQLAHPDGTKADCTTWLVGEREAGRVEIPTQPESGRGQQEGARGGAGGKRGKTGAGREGGAKKAKTSE